MEAAALGGKGGEGGKGCSLGNGDTRCPEKMTDMGEEYSRVQVAQKESWRKKEREEISTKKIGQPQ